MSRIQLGTPKYCSYYMDRMTQHKIFSLSYDWQDKHGLVILMDLNDFQHRMVTCMCSVSFR
jgi:hypothetical protein